MSATITATHPAMRKCQICGQFFPLTPEYFYRDSKKSGGFSYKCKACQRAKCKAYSAKHKSSTTSTSLDLRSVSDEVLTNELRSRGWSGKIKKSVMVSI